MSLYLVSVPLAWADSGSERLEQFYHKVHTLRADFTQQVYNSRSELIQESSGRVVIQQPGHFRWDYASPIHQLIVADGKTLWLYDADLDQVTVRPLNQLNESTPALLLSNQTPLEKTFEISNLEKRDGMWWVELHPRAGAGTFKKVLLGLDEHGPRVMEVTDSFDQVTRLRFDHLVVNPRVKPQVFEFKPPPGVDVIQE